MKNSDTTPKNEFKRHAVNERGELICLNTVERTEQDAVNEQYQKLIPERMDENSTMEPVNWEGVAWAAGILLAIALIFIL